MTDEKAIGKIIVQLSTYYHCSILDLYNTPITQILNIVDLINETGSKEMIGFGVSSGYLDFY